MKLRSNALLIRNAYPLVTAPVGEYNFDTEGFYPWLQEYLESFGASKGAVRVMWKEHLEQQIRTSLEEPDSEIAIFLRLSATIAETEQLGHGAWVYWWRLIGPHPQIFMLTPLEQTAYELGFAALADEYRIARLQNPTEYAEFGEFLLDSQFFRTWFAEK